MEKKNPILEWWNNLKNAKKNFKKVKSSPYASLVLALKVRKMILIPLIIFIIWRGYDTVVNYHGAGFMNTFGKIIMFAIFAYIIYRIYRTIPDAKKQIEYYKKYPHIINYCPTNVKEDVDDILNKIKDNQLNLKGVKKDVSKKEERRKTTKGNSENTKG